MAVMAKPVARYFEYVAGIVVTECDCVDLLADSLGTEVRVQNESTSGPRKQNAGYAERDVSDVIAYPSSDQIDAQP